MASGQKLFEINEIWVTLDEGQRMTLTFGSEYMYRSAQEKSSFFAFTPRTKMLKRELSRRKFREITRKFEQTINFLRAVLLTTTNFRADTPRKLSESFKNTLTV